MFYCCIPSGVFCKLSHFVEQVFPCLDILRVALRNPTINEHFCNSKEGPEFLAYLVKYLDSKGSTINQMLSLRGVANLMCHKPGQDLILANCATLIPAILLMHANTDKNVQIALSTVLMNIAVLLRPTEDMDSKSVLLSALSTAANELTDPEAQFRISTGLGTLIWMDETCKVMAQSLDISAKVEEYKLNSSSDKVRECAKHLCDMLL